MVAIVGSRTKAHFAAAAAALVGISLIVTYSRGSLSGVLLAVGTAVGFATYLTVLGRLKDVPNGTSAAFTIGITTAATALLQFGVQAAPAVTTTVAVQLAVSAVLGTVLRFFLEGISVQRLGARAAGVLFDFDPVVASLAGWLFMSQALGLQVWAGIITVVAAGIVSTLGDVTGVDHPSTPLVDDGSDGSPHAGVLLSSQSLLGRRVAVFADVVTPLGCARRFRC